MNTPTLIALLGLGVSIISLIDAKEHRAWERSNALLK